MFMCDEHLKRHNHKKHFVTSDKAINEHKNLFDKIIEVPWHDKHAKSFIKQSIDGKYFI